MVQISDNLKEFGDLVKRITELRQSTENRKTGNEVIDVLDQLTALGYDIIKYQNRFKSNQSSEHYFDMIEFLGEYYGMLVDEIGEVTHIPRS